MKYYTNTVDISQSNVTCSSFAFVIQLISRTFTATVENIKGCSEQVLLVPNVHLLVEQTSEFDDSPGQYFPPCNGTGLSHFLVLDLKPSPHVTLQEDQSDQRPQLPSTAEHETK